MPTLLQVAVRNPDLSTFLRAVVASDLLDALEKDGNLTVFAPNDEAFSKLLKKIPNLLEKDIAPVLKRHILPKRQLAKDLIGGIGFGIAREKTLSGEVLEVRRVKEFSKSVKTRVMPTKEWAIVKAADILARNGVIHVIDRVM